jgi:hypothetical protein
MMIVFDGKYSGKKKTVIAYCKNSSLIEEVLLDQSQLSTLPSRTFINSTYLSILDHHQSKLISIKYISKDCRWQRQISSECSCTYRRDIKEDSAISGAKKLLF